MIQRTLYCFNRLFSRDRQYYKIINEIFGAFPNNIELYKLALVHKSASIVLEDGSSVNNERLEFLGDAIIEAIVSDMLYIEFPYESEGVLTQLRSRVVSRNSLNDLSSRIGLDEYIVSQNTYGSAARKNMSGDAFEAMIGALYLDKGYDYCNRLLINKIFKEHIKVANILETETDYKSRLIEWGQKRRHKINISSKIENDPQIMGEQHFVAIVEVNQESKGYGIGISKKEAEQRACKNAATALRLKFN